MRKLLIVILLLSAFPALAQTVPPPCGEKGIPDNVPCVDTKSGNVIHTQSPLFVPHQDLSPPPPPGPPVVVPKLQAAPKPVVVPATVAPVVPSFPASPSQGSQSWSYEGTASCYHDADSVQCFDTGTLENYASNRAEFEAQFQAGEVVGSAIGALVRAWIAHRRMLDLARKDSRQQISAYYNATFELNDEVMHDQDELVADYKRLAQLDPRHRNIYEQGAKDAEAFNSRLAMLRPTTERNLPGILAAKDLKYLRRNLDLAKSFYNLTLDAAKKEYVYSQLMQGLVGYFEQQRVTPPTSTGTTATDH